MKARLAEIFATKTRDEWSEIFFDSDACVVPVLSPWEAHEHPANVARGSFVEVGDCASRRLRRASRALRGPRRCRWT